MTGSVHASSCGAVRVGRALDHQDLRAAVDRVVVRKRDVDGAVRPHDGRDAWSRLHSSGQTPSASPLISIGRRPGDPAILGLAEDDREDLADPAGGILLLGTDARPGHIHPVTLRARRARVRDHVRLVLEAHVLVADDAHRHRAVLLKPTLRVRRVEVHAVDAGVGLRDHDRVLRSSDPVDRARDVGVTLRVPGDRRVRASLGSVFVEERDLEERRCLVTPVRSTVERPGVSTVVVTGTGVVLAYEDVVRVERVDGDLLTCLRAERAVLGDARVRLPVAGELVAAALGAGDLDRRRPEPCARGSATERSGLVEERVHDARGEARLVPGCRGPPELDVESVTEHRIGDRRAARCRARQEHSARDQRDAKATDQQKTNMQLASQVPSLTSPRATVQFIGNLGESTKTDKTPK